jgi:hypothetical protein
MTVRLMVLVMAWSMTCGRRQLAVLAEGLAHAVEDDHRLVDRVAQHRQDRRQHGQRELPLEEGEEAQDDHHVVQVGHDAGHRELPLEAQRQVDHDADHRDAQRQRAVGGEFLAHRRADELGALERQRLAFRWPRTPAG